MSKIEELKERVLKYRMLQLPGQPMAAHMGTSYLIGDLLAAVEEYATELDKYVDELADVDARADRLQAENERLRDALEELVDAWDGYEMLAALDADVYRKAQAALEAKGSE